MDFLKFLAVAVTSTFIYGNVAAADWQPLPGAKEGTYYDAQGVIKEDGNFHITSKQYLVKNELVDWGNALNKELRPGAYMVSSELMNCKDRRVYEMYVQFHDHMDKKVGYLDGRGKPASDSVDDLRFSGAHHNLFSLFNKLCGINAKK